MSPANRRISQTPGAAKRKHSRISLSPTKAAHAIRFNDIVLPSSPSKTQNNGRQRSLSPEKADGNVSPWRIRVTLEATQDEQENQGSPSRKQSKSATTTTKIPLKDSSEQTPRKRGRPRKSAALDATPLAGSPGNTPGAMNSEQKRRRGRPRKYQPEPVAIADDEPPEQHPQPEEDVQMVDAAPTSAEPEQHSWSPLNLAGDADSDDGLDDNQPLDIPFDAPAQTEFAETNLLNRNQNSQPTFERTYETHNTPNGDAIDRFHLGQGDDELHSTPSKIPSPTRDSQIPSPENSLFAGHTPMPPRTHPAPELSSPVDDEQRQHRRNSFPDSSKPNKAPSNEPRSENEDFDTIIESEGFSKISLESIPSVRQQGLESGSKLVKGALKPFMEREANGVIRRKTSTQDRQAEEALPHSPSPDPRPLREHPPVSQPPASVQSDPSKRTPFSPLPPQIHPPPPQEKPVLRLAKLVRAGIALERVLSHSNTHRPGGPMPDYMEPRQRLEATFDDLDPGSKRVLQAALGLGQVLAIRRKLRDLRSPQRKALIQEELEENDDLDSPNSANTRPEISKTPMSQYDGPAESSSPDTEMKRRFADWQRERDAVSRTIQMASPGQVIVVDSDAETPSPLRRYYEGEEFDDSQDIWAKRRQQAHQAAVEKNHGNQNVAEQSPRVSVLDDEHQDVSEAGFYGNDDGAGSSHQVSGEQDHQQLVDDEDDVKQDPWLPRREEKSDEHPAEEHHDSEAGDNGHTANNHVPVQQEEPHHEEEGYNNANGIRYDIRRSPRIIRERDQGDRVIEDYDNDEPDDQVYSDNDGGYEDIWQEQAQDEENSEALQNPRNHEQFSSSRAGSDPAERGYSTTYSPGYWMDGEGRIPSLGQSKVRQLREQAVDVSALLDGKDTPNRARYYYGKSSPLSTGQGRSPQQGLSSATSQRRKDAERNEPGLEDPDADFEGAEEQEDSLDFNPEEDLDDDFQIDPTTRHESEMQRHQSDSVDNASLSDAGGEEPVEESVHEEILTPKNQQPVNKDIQASSWYQKITSLTPNWLKAPVRNSSPRHRGSTASSSHEIEQRPSPSQDQDRVEEDHNEDEETQPEHGHEEDDRKDEEPPLDAESESESASEIEQRPSPGPQPQPARTSATPKQTQRKPQTRLATSGYFSNAHYTLLRRLYRLAKQSPESFPYRPTSTTSSHSSIIGDYIWTSDNTYGVPITELQFAIVYRFRQQIAAADLENGGTGWVGWSDADLHRRLVSIIIGEQIREDLKIEKDARPSRSRPRSILQRG